MDGMPFPSESKECHGCWVSVSKNVGNFMTFKVLMDDTLKVIHCSNIHSARDPNSMKMHLELFNGEPPVVIKSL